MKYKSLIILCFVIGMLFYSSGEINAQRLMEHLNRGVVAIHQSGDSVFVGWRMLGTDPEDIAFNLYRRAGKDKPVKLNTELIKETTNFTDTKADFTKENAYFVKPVINAKELDASESYILKANSPVQPYLSVPLQTLEGHTSNDASIADLDGDGQYDIVLKQEIRPKDNSHKGVTGTTKLEGYKLDGTMLWRIDLGKNVREGAHYTPFIVYDFNGDGTAEIAVRTAEETIDGTGVKIGDTNADGKTDYVNPETGYILEGPEFISIYDGKTGKELARDNYIARGKLSDWGDTYGNRVDRFLMGLAYLDGVLPSLIICRGYYELTKLEAWNYRDGKLTKVWSFSSKDNPGYDQQGNHNLSIADVDGDGKDEIIYGAMTIDDNGKGLYTTRLGHGDALHVSDLDPDRPGLEVFDIQERFDDAGANFRDARTGEVIWKKASVAAGKDGEGPGRGLALDVDPRYKGFECWVAGAGIKGMFDCKGNLIADKTPACNMGIYWDGDLLSEILNGTTIDKWDYVNGTTNRLLQAQNYDCASNNGTKANPCISADIFGDWREEVIWRTKDNKELRIFTSTIPTKYRFYTFMHDPVYRLGIAWQNVAYNQPPHTSFYLGDGMQKAPVPSIAVKRQKIKDVRRKM